MKTRENMEEENLQDALAILPRPGLLTQDSPTLMGILTLGNKLSEGGTLRNSILEFWKFKKVYSSILFSCL